jgi:hypothetical protein
MENIITLTETYYDLGFLEKLASLGASSATIQPNDIMAAKKILKRLRTSNKASVAYEQKEYQIGNGRNERFGRYWPNHNGFVCY